MKLNLDEIVNPEITESDIVFPDDDNLTDVIANNPHQEEIAELYAKFSRPILLTCDKLDLIVNNYHKGYITSQEGFSGLINSPLTGLVNVIGHVTKLFSTALFTGWRDFKRSELKEYVDSNIASTALLLNSGVYQDYQHLQIPTPVGMIGTYPEAIAAINEYLTELSMDKKTKNIASTLEAISKDLFGGSVNNAFTSHVNDLNRTVLTKSIEQKYTKLTKIFTANKKEGGTFRTHFFDMSSLKKAVHDVTAMDAHLITVASVYGRLEQITSTVESIVEGSKDLKAAQVSDISKAVRAVAVLFEQYAITLNDLNRINHNLTILLTQLRKATS